MSNFIYAWEIDKTLKPIKDDTIEVIAYANKSDKYFPYFLKTSNKFNYPLKIVGWGETWVDFGNKLIGYYNYLKTVSNKDKYVLVTDSWDVLFLRDYNDFINEVDYTKYDIIFSSNLITKENWSELNIKRYFINYYLMLFFGSEKKSFLNAGIFIIKIQLYIDIYESNIPTLKTDDQRFFVNFVNTNNFYKKYNIYIDDNNLFFLNFDVNIKKDDKCINRLNNKEINPFIVHGNGGTDLTKIIKIIYNDALDNELNDIITSRNKIKLDSVIATVVSIMHSNILPILSIVTVLFLLGIKFINKMFFHK